MNEAPSGALVVYDGNVLELASLDLYLVGRGRYDRGAEVGVLPLADVEQVLIALEGQYSAQVQDGSLTDVDDLDWKVSNKI